MPLTNAGRVVLLDEIKDLSDAATTLTLKAYNAPDPTAVLLDSATATYASPISGNPSTIDLASDVTLTIPTGETVDTVRLYKGATEIATYTMTSGNSFPNGGDLIIQSYKISVS
jgi:hypothetical protein